MTRLITYNILEGLRDPITKKLDTVRLDALRQFVDETKPDILILNEANWCAGYPGCPIIFNYQYELGFGYSLAALWNQSGSWGNVILSNHPIVRGDYMSAVFHRNALWSVIDVNGKHVYVSTYHPFPYYENKREAFGIIADWMETNDPAAPKIIAGDFNSLSPEDGHTVEAYTATLFRAGFTHAPTMAKGFITDSGVPALLNRGYVDALPKENRGRTIPTRISNQHKPHSPDDTGTRLDHIFIKDGVTVLSCEIVKNYMTDMISDHFPVMMDFELA